MRAIGISSCALMAGLAFASSAAAAATVVSPTSANGWTGYSTDSSGALNTGTATADFASGPATPPLGTGSAHLQTGPGAGDGSAQYRTTNFAGIKLSDLTTLNYSTYATAWNGQQLPYLTIWIDTTNDGSADDRIWFEPDYTSPAALNTWQTWTTLSGNWYSDNGVASSGPGSDAKSFATIAGALGSDATIVNAAPGVGGFRIASGFASASDNFNAYFDAVSVATSTGTSLLYDFEPAGAAAVPLPVASLAGLGLTGVMALRRVRRA